MLVSHKINPPVTKGFCGDEFIRNYVQKSYTSLFVSRFKSCKVDEARCGNNDAMIKAQSIPKLRGDEGVKGLKRGPKGDFNIYKR